MGCENGASSSNDAAGVGSNLTSQELPNTFKLNGTLAISTDVQEKMGTIDPTGQKVQLVDEQDLLIVEGTIQKGNTFSLSIETSELRLF